MRKSIGDEVKIRQWVIDYLPNDTCPQRQSFFDSPTCWLQKEEAMAWHLQQDAGLGIFRAHVKGLLLLALGIWLIHRMLCRLTTPSFWTTPGDGLWWSTRRCRPTNGPRRAILTSRQSIGIGFTCLFECASCNVLHDSPGLSYVLARFYWPLASHESMEGVQIQYWTQKWDSLFVFAPQQWLSIKRLYPLDSRKQRRQQTLSWFWWVVRPYGWTCHTFETWRTASSLALQFCWRTSKRAWMRSWIRCCRRPPSNKEPLQWWGLETPPSSGPRTSSHSPRFIWNWRPCPDSVLVP